MWHDTALACIIRTANSIPSFLITVESALYVKKALVARSNAGTSRLTGYAKCSLLLLFYITDNNTMHCNIVAEVNGFLAITAIQLG